MEEERRRHVSPARPQHVSPLSWSKIIPMSLVHIHLVLNCYSIISSEKYQPISHFIGACLSIVTSMYALHWSIDQISQTTYGSKRHALALTIKGLLGALPSLTLSYSVLTNKCGNATMQNTSFHALWTGAIFMNNLRQGMIMLFSRSAPKYSLNAVFKKHRFARDLQRFVAVIQILCAGVMVYLVFRIFLSLQYFDWLAKDAEKRTEQYNDFITFTFSITIVGIAPLIFQYYKSGESQLAEISLHQPAPTPRLLRLNWKTALLLPSLCYICCTASVVWWSLQALQSVQTINDTYNFENPFLGLLLVPIIGLLPELFTATYEAYCGHHNQALVDNSNDFFHIICYGAPLAFLVAHSSDTHLTYNLAHVPHILLLGSCLPTIAMNLWQTDYTPWSGVFLVGFHIMVATVAVFTQS